MLFRSGDSFSGGNYCAVPADRADNDRAGAQQFVAGGVDTYFLRGREPRLGEESQGGELPAGDSVCGGLRLSAVVLTDSKCVKRDTGHF